jgi:hypothetical protein
VGVFGGVRGGCRKKCILNGRASDRGCGRPACKERQYAVVSCRWRDYALLADSIAVMDCVSVLSIAWLGRTTGWGGSAGGSKVFLEGADGLEGVCCGGFGTVNYYWLPNAHPVFDVCG